MCLCGNYGSFYEKIFAWTPNEEQWWITGFNPEFTKPDPYNMTMLCSVNFETEDFFEAFIATYKPDNEEIIFYTEYCMVWIMR